MTVTLAFDQLTSPAEDIIKSSQQLLKTAPLNAQQRSDLEAILAAARRFRDYALTEVPKLSATSDVSDYQRVRHQLRNHLNIVVGFSRLIVRELPDNLILHMMPIRRILEKGETLLENVSQIH